MVGPPRPAFKGKASRLRSVPSLVYCSVRLRSVVGRLRWTCHSRERSFVMSKFMLSMGLVLASLPAFSSAGQGVEPSRPTQVEAASSAQTVAYDDDGDFDDIGPYKYFADAVAECNAWRAHGSEANVYMDNGSYYVRVT